MNPDRVMLQLSNLDKRCKQITTKEYIQISERPPHIKSIKIPSQCAGWEIDGVCYYGLNQDALDRAIGLLGFVCGIKPIMAMDCNTNRYQYILCKKGTDENHLSSLSYAKKFDAMLMALDELIINYPKITA